jgi:hypothetical protein
VVEAKDRIDLGRHMAQRLTLELNQTEFLRNGLSGVMVSYTVAVT